MSDGGLSAWNQWGRACISSRRIDNLRALAAKAMELNGEFWECGVFRGGSARIIADILRPRPRMLRLFDTFSGFPFIAPEDESFPDYAMFTTTSAGDVARFVDAKFAVIHVGKIPETFAGLEGARLAFLHLDVDLYLPTKAALAFALPRMLPGGAIVVDDCGDPDWPGVILAVREQGCEVTLHCFGKHDHQGVIST
jgi:O-methyltransferase